MSGSEISERPSTRSTRSHVPLTAKLTVEVITVAALVKAAIGILACVALLDHPALWARSIPPFLQMVVLSGFLAGAVLLPKNRLRYLLSAAILSSIAAAYALPALEEAGIPLARFRIEGLLPLLFWLLTLVVPGPFRSQSWRRVALVCVAASAVIGALTFAQDVFLLSPRPWGPEYLQFWDLGIPLIGLAVTVMAIRSFLAGESFGLSYAVAFAPVVAMLLLEAIVPSIGRWAAVNRPLIAGFLSTFMLTLPVWLVRASRLTERLEA